MKKIKLLTALTLFPILATVSACGNQVSPSNQRKFSEGPEDHSTLREVDRLGMKSCNPAPTVGTTKVLVVPVEFSNFPAEYIGKYAFDYYGNVTEVAAEGKSKEASKQDIYNAYFGEASDTVWHSLKSYYYESSYGKLTFDGLVADWFKVYDNYTTMEWITTERAAETGAGSGGGLAATIRDYFSDKTLKGYKQFKNADGSQMFSSGEEFLNYFDGDGDGYIDIIEIVYSAPYHCRKYDENFTIGKNVYESIDDDVFWAYCGGTYENPNKRAPSLAKWAFQSYYTLIEGGTVDESGNFRDWTLEEVRNGTAKPDAHTLIHETGHALGLPDYYDYDYKKQPAGVLDMMDNNVGDHNSHSKSLLGWVDPIVVTGPTQVEVKSFTDTGECIMVPYRGHFKDNPTYGNTFCTEYLAIELYTPTGVNEFDMLHKYAGRTAKLPDIPGIKIYHVDARLGLFTVKDGYLDFNSYCDYIVGTGSGAYVNFAHSNTGSRTVNKTWLLEFLPSSQDTKLRSVSAENLFKAGDVFGADGNYANYKFHSGKSFGYRISIDSVSSTSATLTFYAA